MKYLSLTLLFIPAAAFAAAGFADAYNDHQHWIFPAYAYCLAFGLVFLLALFIISLVWKSEVRRISEAITSYLRKNSILAIILSGILLAIPIGIIGAVSWEIIWFLSIFPFMGLMIAYPLILVNKHLREKWLLSQCWIKWSMMVAISSVSASLLFIFLTNCDLLPGADITYLARPDRTHRDFYSPTHPYDSMCEIWTLPLFFVGEIVIALAFYALGMLNRQLCRKLSDIRHRKQKNIQEIYVED